MQTALKLEAVGKRYGEFEAVRDLSFEVAPGRICGFLGPNGAGKTSTIRMILGLVEPTSGRISVLEGGDGRSARARIGFLPEERGLYRRMTPLEAISFLASLKGLSSGEARRKAQSLLEDNGLGHAMRRQIRSLSKGMAQKVQLLSALAHEPELVILDEPFSGLDPVNQQELEGLIRGLAARGATVLFSTHVMQHAERLCEQVVLISGGRKVFDGRVDEARAAAPRRLILEGAIAADAAAALPGLTQIACETMATGELRVTGVLVPGAPAQTPLRAAFERGLDITRFELKEPHLHDAFIVLTGARETGA
jgi:ABC-2 type transport system ATP-binding protein